MGWEDKAENTRDKVVGETKEQVGKATDDEQLEAEGRGQQAEGHLKSAVEDVKDAFKK